VISNNHKIKYKLLSTEFMATPGSLHIHYIAALDKEAIHKFMLIYSQRIKCHILPVNALTDNESVA
jgi:hypothetical protein